MQQLNPLGSSGSWEAALVLGFATWSYVVLSTVVGQAKITSREETLLGVVLISASIVFNTVAAAPRNRQYRRFDFVLVIGLALVAALLQGTASSGGVASIATDWGPLAFAGVLAASSSFRPRVDFIWAGLIAAVIIAVQKTMEGIAGNPPYGSVYFVVTAVAPVVIVTMGQAAYVGFASRSLNAWRRGFQQTRDDLTALAGSDVTLKVAHEFLTEFSADVQPLLTRILKSGQIAAKDSVAAADVSERIRTRLVSVAQQTWLERLGPPPDDPLRLAEKFDLSSRAATTALVRAFTVQGVSNVSIRLENLEKSSKIAVYISGNHAQSRLNLRARLAPIFRVLYVVFRKVRAVFGTTTVTVQFDYGLE